MPASTDREGLLAAIRAAPGDDTPRLVYADWLDEHGGDAEQARARFIRLQIESDRLRRQSEDDGCPEPDAVGPMEKEAERLLRKNKAAFLTGLPIGNGFAIYFKRGMPENAVARSGKDFARRAVTAFAAAPIRSLTFSQILPDEVPAILATGQLRHVESMNLHSDSVRTALLPEVVARLSASAEVGPIRRLCVQSYYGHNADVDRLVQSIASSGEWNSLTSLALHLRGQLHAESLGGLAKSKTVPALQDLDLALGEKGPGPTLAIETPGALARCFPQLRVLRMHGRYLSNPIASTFLQPKAFNHLRRLTVEGQHVMDDPNVLMGLLTSANLASLVSLDLTGGAGPLPLASAKRPRRFRPPTLRALTLTHCGLTDADVEALVRLPSLHGLRFLALGDNAIGPDGAAALAAAPWQNLSCLVLYGNDLGDRGAAALSSPSLAKLTSLNLSGDVIGPDGARAIAASPHLGGLSNLILSEKPLGAEGLAALKKRFGRKSGAHFRRAE
jgi:uncharacterized protein (TIGR02996 family)